MTSASCLCELDERPACCDVEDPLTGARCTRGEGHGGDEHAHCGNKCGPRWPVEADDRARRIAELRAIGRDADAVRLARG
jgi:hypothetical protein